MNAIASNRELAWKPPAAIKLAGGTEAGAPRFNFAQRRKERLLGAAQYLMLVRRRHADKAKVSWAFRGMRN
jgi:hypothetical protein